MFLAVFFKIIVTKDRSETVPDPRGATGAYASKFLVWSLDMFRSHDLADKETVMGLFDTQCLLLTTLPETFRILSALSLSARSREMARLCFTIRK